MSENRCIRDGGFSKIIKCVNYRDFPSISIPLFNLEAVGRKDKKHGHFKAKNSGIFLFDSMIEWA